MRQIQLANGDVVTIKPLTLKQAKACNFSKILSKFMESVSEDGTLETIPFDEDTIIKVVSQVYPKIDNITFAEALDIFMAVIEETSAKN